MSSDEGTFCFKLRNVSVNAFLLNHNSLPVIFLIVKLFACVCETDACCHGNKQSHKFSAVEIREKSRRKDIALRKSRHW